MCRMKRLVGTDGFLCCIRSLESGILDSGGVEGLLSGAMALTSFKCPSCGNPVGRWKSVRSDGNPAPIQSDSPVQEQS